MINRAALWLQAMQAPAVVVTLIPVALGSSFAFWDRTFDGWLFLLTLFAVFLLQVGSALLASASDHARYTITGNPFLAHPLLSEGVFTIREFQFMAAVLLGLACCCGIGLALMSGPLIWWFGLFGVIAVFLYRAKLQIVAFPGSVELLTFLMVGPLISMGSYYVQTGIPRYQALFCAIPIGLLASLIETVTHLRDLPLHRKHPQSNLAKWLGRRKTAFLVQAEILAVYIGTLALLIAGWLPGGSALCFLTLPFAVKIIRLVQHERTPRQLHMLVGDMILLYVSYGLLLVIGYDLHLLMWRV